VIKISELYVHPLKSAAAISLEQVVLDEFGLQHDRRWMLVDASGNFLSQRQLPEMCLISAEVMEASLKLKAPGMPDIDAFTNESSVSEVTVWGDQCNARDCGEDVAEWLSYFLNTSCRLVYFPDDENRQVDIEYANQGDRTGFSDGFPLLLISQASLDDLNDRLSSPVVMKRFRPNIVVSGTEAFAEDNWKEIKVGDITMRVVKPCSRCSIPSVDPQTGKRSAEPVKTLRSYRLRDSKVYFGQNVIAEGTGMFELGMPVEIIK